MSNLKKHNVVIGKICRDTREKLKMSLTELSQKTGWSVDQLNDFENGIGISRTFKFREPICVALGLTDRQLAPWPEDLPEIYGEQLDKTEKLINRNDIVRTQFLQFVQVLQLYKESSDEIKEVVDQMTEIAIDPNSDQDEIHAAIDTVIEALFPDGNKGVRRIL